MADAVGLRASRGLLVLGLAGIASIVGGFFASKPPNAGSGSPPRLPADRCSTSLSSELQPMCGPYGSPSEVFGEPPGAEDFASLSGGWPFDAVTVLTHGDPARADFSQHARVALVVQIDDAWWGIELGTSGPICVQGTTVETSGPAWIETTTSDLRLAATERGRHEVVVTKHDRFTRNGAVRQTDMLVTCSVRASATPSCREVPLGGSRLNRQRVTPTLPATKPM